MVAVVIVVALGHDRIPPSPDGTALGIPETAPPSAAPLGVPGPGPGAASPQPLALVSSYDDRLPPEIAPPPPARLSPSPPAMLSGYRWPLESFRISQRFGPVESASRIVAGRPFHDGLDLDTFCGDRIYAAHGGLVLAAGRRFDDFIGYTGDLTAYYRRLTDLGLWGTLPLVVVIDDGNGYRSMYAHFEKVSVKAGQVVTAGSLLGYEGRSGGATHCHLHYGLFSPDELATIEIDPGFAARMRLPPAEVARIDPLLVLPPLRSSAPIARQ